MAGIAAGCFSFIGGIAAANCKAMLMSSADNIAAAEGGMSPNIAAAEGGMSPNIAAESTSSGNIAAADANASSNIAAAGSKGAGSPNIAAVTPGRDIAAPKGKGRASTEKEARADKLGVADMLIF